MRTAGSRRPRSPSGRASAGVSAARRNSFLGRDEQVSELLELLENERLITLTGAPGIGKSRLGLELAKQVARRDRGARQVVELAAVARAGDVPRAVAAALSVQEVAGESLVDVLVARLSRRRSLLVLDNCEHLVASCRELIEALLAGCPKLGVVATSREPLGLASERVWQVPPLAVPAADKEISPEGLTDYAAVALFVERAAAAQPGFALNAYVAPAVSEICRRLDGIPLAIELAAARVVSHTPEEIARRLEDRFTLLVGGAGDALPRHQTLQAALDWSHELLSEAERTLLRRLAVFSGAFELEGAEAVCSGGEIEPGDVAGLLARLVAKSLVIADATKARPTRFGLLETVRLYAVGRLDEAGEAPERRLSHARFYLALADRAEPELTGADQMEWLERLEADRANLRAALEWSLSHGEEELALRLAGALVLFWRVRCHFSEGRELLEGALSATGDGADAGLRAKALWGAGLLALMAGDLDAALPSLEQSLTLFREVDDPGGCARALLVLGNRAQFRQEDGDPLPMLDESATLARKAGDAWCLSHALAIAGLELSRRTDLTGARPRLEECMAVAREAEDKQGMRFGLLGLGSLCVRQGDYRLAEGFLAEALALATELGEHYTRAIAHYHLGELSLGRGDYSRASALLDEAEAEMPEVAPPFARVGALLGRAEVARAYDEPERARCLFEEAVGLVRGRDRTSVAALRGLGELAAEEGDARTARRFLEEALGEARALDDKLGLASALHALGQLARSEGAPEWAALLHHEALELRARAEAAPGIVASLEALAGLEAAGGRHRRAALLLAAAQAARDDNGYARPPWEAPSHRGDLDLVRGALSPAEQEAAWAKGKEMSIDEAVGELLGGSDGSAEAPASGWSSLSPRERQVMALVADGLTNREIAERLAIAPGTVKNHVASILSKLGLTGRRLLVQEAHRGRGSPWRGP